MVLPPADFESAASTGSAIPAASSNRRENYNCAGCWSPSSTTSCRPSSSPSIPPRERTREPPAAPATPQRRARRPRIRRPAAPGRRARRPGPERHARDQGAPRRAQGERRQGRALRRAHRRAARGAGAHPGEPSARGRHRGARSARRARHRRRRAKASSTGCASPRTSRGCSSATAPCRCRPTSRTRPTPPTPSATRPCTPRAPGAVAAPTAGLHFDDALLAALERARRGASRRLTLHVGAGTFQPVRSERVEAHRMHSERYSIPASDACSRWQIGACSRSARPRCARSRARRRSGELEGETDLFISPGFEFRVVERLLTNFHLPRSTLLMLVQRLRRQGHASCEAYATRSPSATASSSYGDAMLIER